MPVKVRCSGCEKVLTAPDKLRGKTVKCPKCQSPIKIPAPRQKPAKQEPDPFSDDFLADLDLSQAEDESQQVCPRCGAAVREDDFDCPACGADLTAGEAVASSSRKSPVGRKKKGPNKSLFYRNVWSDAFAFFQKNRGYAIKTSLIVFILYLLHLGATFMFLWCINLPPKAFWALLMFVFYMAPIGWIWHFFTETIRASLAKQTRMKRVNFDFFTCIAYGIKFFAWQIVCGFPILIPAGIAAGVLFNSGSLIGAAVAETVGSLLLLSLLPVAMTHMAMPQQLPGWNPLKVFAGWGKSIGANAYWILILVLTSLPVTGCVGAIGATSGNKIQAFYRTMESNAEIHRQKQKAEEDESVQPPAAEPSDLPWNNLTIPGVLLSVALLLTGPVVVFNARVVGQIAYYYSPEMDLNALEKQLKYKAKPKPGEAGKVEKINRQGLSTVAGGLTLMFLSVSIVLLCELALIGLSLAVRFSNFQPPPFVGMAIGIGILGSMLMFMIGVLLGFAAPAEAQARLFLFLSFASPFLATIFGGMAIAGVATLQDVTALAVMGLVVYGGIVVSILLTFVFFILFLKQLSEYLYYYAGSALADSIIFLYAAAVGVLVLAFGIGFAIGMMGGAPPVVINSIGGVISVIFFGLQINIFIKLIELLGGLKEECRQPA